MTYISITSLSLVEGLIKKMGIVKKKDKRPEMESLV